ncbi:MAG: hypothetical protein OXG95_02720 [Chloroflexi bacterium]|nr:hypothetical protein [Chloroflexota bacterium]
MVFDLVSRYLRTVWSRASASGVTPWIVGVISAALALVLALVLGSPSWLPDASDARPLILGLLAAQAAIAALTLAVALFVLQGVATRQDADDRFFQAYVRRSWVGWLFPLSLIAVATTAAALLLGEFGGAGMPLPGDARNLPNLTLVTAVAFLTNLALSGLLFHRGVRLATPAAWRQLRRDVNERDVESAVRAFVTRHERLRMVDDGDPEQAWPDLFPGPDEGSADEAVAALLDDSRRAMDERRTAAFAAAFDSLREMLTHAMDELEGAGVDWSPPGPTTRWPWPPLAELSGKLPALREEVIRRGEEEHVRTLFLLDRWLVGEGLKRGCGELFTAGLDGYAQSYAIAARSPSGAYRSHAVESVWLAVRDALRAAGAEPEGALPYLKEAVRWQERLLARALDERQAEDFGSLRTRFAELLDWVGRHWGVDAWPRPPAADLQAGLLQDARIALLGLGGRALELARSGAIEDISPYLDVTCGEYNDPQRLADDLAQALSSPEYSDRFSWTSWQFPTGSGTGPMLDPHRYVLSFGMLRLLELATSPLPDLDLHGSADVVLNRLGSSGHLERFLEPHPDVDMEERRARVREALEAAVRRDRRADEDAIIGSELSAGRVEGFVSDVRASRFAADAIEGVFKEANAFLSLQPNAADAPAERRSKSLQHKAHFIDHREGVRTHHQPLDGEPWAEELRDDVVRKLCDALAGAPEMGTPLASADAFPEAVDGALAELDPEREVLVLFIGDWARALLWVGDDVLRRSRGGDAAGTRVWGRYGNHPVVWELRSASERDLYVVEPGRWGRFVRAQVNEGQDLVVGVSAVTQDDAREMLDSDPNLFPDEPDDSARLRRLQTRVAIDVVERTGFRVLAPARARRVHKGGADEP